MIPISDSCDYSGGLPFPPSSGATGRHGPTVVGVATCAGWHLVQVLAGAFFCPDGQTWPARLPRVERQGGWQGPKRPRVGPVAVAGLGAAATGTGQGYERQAPELSAVKSTFTASS